MADFPDFEREFERVEAQFKQAETQLRAANEEIDRRAGRPLLPAILTGVVLGAIVIVGLFFLPVLAIFAILILALAAFELATALRDAGRRVPRIPLVVLSVAIVAAAFWLGDWWRWVAFLGSIAVLVAWRLVELSVPRRRAGARQVLEDIGAGAFVLTYVTLLGSFDALLLAKRPDGEWWLLGSLIVIVVTDIAAYAVGRSLGRHKMAPRVSPNKSWEGFAGSAAAALIAGVLVAWLLLHERWWFGLIFGAVLLLTATVGDLAESLIKRDLGVKDMSKWLPGHGGILDRLDGIVLSAPFAYLLYVLLH